MNILYQQALHELWEARRFFSEATGEMVDVATYRLKYAEANYSAVVREIKRGQVA